MMRVINLKPSHEVTYTPRILETGLANVKHTSHDTGKIVPIIGYGTRCYALPCKVILAM